MGNCVGLLVTNILANDTAACNALHGILNHQTLKLKK